MRRAAAVTPHGRRMERERRAKHGPSSEEQAYHGRAVGGETRPQHGGKNPSLVVLLPLTGGAGVCTRPCQLQFWRQENIDSRVDLRCRLALIQMAESDNLAHDALKKEPESLISAPCLP